MAVVGEAYILVRAITTEIKKDIANGFDGVKGQSTKEGHAAGQAFGQGFGNKMRDEATASAKGFHQLMRRGYSVQAGIGAAATSISALIGGLGALGGALLGAAASGVAFVGVMAQIKVGAAVAKLAFKGVLAATKETGSEGTKSLRELREEMQQLAFAAEDAALSEQDAAIKLEKARETLARVQDLPPNNRGRREAELAYSQAELAYRKAKDKNNDAQEELTNPKKKKKEGTDPYKGLSESQKEFAKYLKTLKPEMLELREAAAKGFLPVLKEQMQGIVAGGGFDLLKQGFKDVSQGLGNATVRLTNTIFDPNNKKNLSEFFSATGVTMGRLGGIVGNFFGVFLRVMKAANPLIEKFTGFLDRKSALLGESSKKNFVELQTFFTNAGTAAGTLGRILSNVFQPIKRLLMSQVAPGSPGMEFLNWIKQSTERLREFQMGADGLTLNEKLKPMVENTKAILQAFGGFASMIMSLGQNPGVADFWNTLAKGTGSLEKIMNGIASTTGPALANVIVRLLEIVAAFTDSGQLKAYFDVLAGIFQIFSVIATALSGIMAFFGGATGALGAFITSWLLLKKALMLVYGSWGIVRGAIIAVVTVQQRQIMATKVQTALEAKYLILNNRKRIAEALSTVQLKKQVVGQNAKTLATLRDNIATNTNISTTKRKNFVAALDAAMSKKGATAIQMKRIAEMQATVGTRMSTDATYKKVAADMSATVTGNGSAAAMRLQAIAAAAGIAPVTIFGITLNAALWPILAIAAALAIAIGAIALAVGHQQDQMKDAQASTTKAMKDTATSGSAMNMQLARSQKVWTAAASSTEGATTAAYRNVQKLEGPTKDLMKAQKDGGDVWRQWGGWAISTTVLLAPFGMAIANSDNELRDYKETLKNTGVSLANLAKKSLKSAQQEFIKLANSNKLGRDELIAQIKEMPEFQEQLKKTADKYNLVTDAMSEEEKQAVYTDIALNEGEYAAIKAGEAQQKLAQKLQAAAASFIDLQSPIEAATVKGKLDLKKYNDMIKKQFADQQAYLQNMQKLNALGLTATAREQLLGMGAEGATLVAEMAKTGQTAVDEFNKTVGFGLLDGKVLSALVANSGPLLSMVGEKIGGRMGVGVVERLEEDLRTGKTSIQSIMKKYKISASEVNDYMQTLPNPVIQQDVSWNQGSIAKAQKQLEGALGGSFSATVDKIEKKANGGLIVKRANGGLMGYANGGNVMKRFAPGGQVFGQGGPRSDKIPAMLSNGEYVVNAAATSRALPLLNALNYGVTQANGPAGTMVGGGGGSLMNSVNITVNPSPGMDETELAAMVSRELSSQMRRGASS
jgi:hypothetical protein